MKILGRPIRHRGLHNRLVAILILILPVTTIAADGISFCFNNWPPYAIVSSGKAEGISRAIISVAGRRLGKQLRFVEMPWNDCLQKVKEGEIDALIDAAQRDEYLQGPTSFSLFTDTFWVANHSQISRYGDLNGGKIGLVAGYNYNENLLAQIDDLNLTIAYAEDDPANYR